MTHGIVVHDYCWSAYLTPACPNIISTLDRVAQTLNDEILSLNLELSSISQRNSDLQADNAALLQRWIDKMNLTAEEMNEEFEKEQAENAAAGIPMSESLASSIVSLDTTTEPRDKGKGKEPLTPKAKGKMKDSTLLAAPKTTPKSSASISSSTPSLKGTSPAAPASGARSRVVSDARSVASSRTVSASTAGGAKAKEKEKEVTKGRLSDSRSSAKGDFR